VAYDENFTQVWEADPVQLTILPTYSLTATTTGGGSITISPTNGPYLSNTLLTITAIPAEGWWFLQWLGDAIGTEPTISIVMNRDKCVRAVLGTTLSTTASGNGAVHVTPVAEFFPYGYIATLVAVPQPGNYFALWGNAGNGTNNPFRLPVTDANPVISSLFAPLSSGQFALTVIPDGSGQVSVNPRSSRYRSGQVVTLTATPDLHQSFLNWGGDGSGTDNPLVLAMTQSYVITANFTRKPCLAVGDCAGHAIDEALPLIVKGELGDHIQIDHALDLSTWTPLAILTNQYGTLQFNDPSVTNQAQGFYRAILAP